MNRWPGASGTGVRNIAEKIALTLTRLGSRRLSWLDTTLHLLA